MTAEKFPKLMDWKLAGYLISSFSVALLGIAGWPSTPDKWRMILLIPGMAASVAGMMCRYISHRHDKAAIAFAQEEARKAKRLNDSGTRTDTQRAAR